MYLHSYLSSLSLSTPSLPDNTYLPVPYSPSPLNYLPTCPLPTPLPTPTLPRAHLAPFLPDLRLPSHPYRNGARPPPHMKPADSNIIFLSSSISIQWAGRIASNIFPSCTPTICFSLLLSLPQTPPPLCICIMSSSFSVSLL
jgi:hypothetical protein